MRSGTAVHIVASDVAIQSRQWGLDVYLRRHLQLNCQKERSDKQRNKLGEVTPTVRLCPLFPPAWKQVTAAQWLTHGYLLRSVQPPVVSGTAHTPLHCPLSNYARQHFGTLRDITNDDCNQEFSHSAFIPDTRLPKSARTTTFNEFNIMLIYRPKSLSFGIGLRMTPTRLTVAYTVLE